MRPATLDPKNRSMQGNISIKNLNVFVLILTDLEFQTKLHGFISFTSQITLNATTQFGLANHLALIVYSIPNTERNYLKIHTSTLKH